ncbi:MAG: hypothetical protein ACKOD9_18100, partial [Rubrivivax sp.]
ARHLPAREPLVAWAAPWATMDALHWGLLFWATFVSAFLGWLVWGWVNERRGVARTACRAADRG